MTWYKLWPDWSAKWQHLSWQQRGLLLEAMVGLALARLAVKTVPFKLIMAHLGGQMAESPSMIAPATAVQSQQIGWAIRAAARRTPWGSNCMAQALCGFVMLKRRQINSTLYLGVARTPERQLQAHAWLRCGHHIITGVRGHQRFTAVATFVATFAE